ncbi:unnamed protein product [Parascedosporium putredinis]|uniref:DNA-directed DNA polymerase family B exonuclease domain-containing protein n=1 Tax=Parascedosporium putredinis TaxID=1442378 RepID=A0A9P1GWM7_9PEZI|nr:unnamed protein product [Parascedosporium putredinis]CAI7988371.1 unnamed protein product [Parascedosporium putredinis]
MASSLPQKRVLADTTNSKQNIPSTPTSAKKRRVEPPSSSQLRPPGSQGDPRSKLSSSQVKSVFESDVLEKLSQDVSELKSHNAEKDQVWERPPLDGFVPSRDSLCFQSIDAEEGYLSGGRPTVKLFGVTEKGNSVMLHVTDFKHYLFVAAPVSFQPSDCDAYMAFLDSVVECDEPCIHSVNLVMRIDIYEYRGNIESPYIKITLKDPRLAAKVRSAIESGEANWKDMFP